MRQGQSQQNRNRPRGRGNRNKGGHNQSNRNMESNGPDVKIRGTATHIAEKYATLARDAQSSGDIVAAENYFQHAEHYNRLVATAQAAQAAQIAQREARRNEDLSRKPAHDNNRDDQVEARDKSEVAEGAAVPDAVQGSGPQPVFDNVPAEVAIKQPMTNGSGESNAGKAEPESKTERRPRRAPRRPRKTAAAAEKESAESSEDTTGELPAFIVGANDG